MKRTISKKEKQELSASINTVVIGDKETVQYDDKKGIYYIDGEPFMALTGDDIIPLLRYKQHDYTRMPSIIVDMPAVPHIINGANLLRPGITAMEEYDQGSIIIVRDENNKVPIAVMKSLYDSTTIMSMDKGKVALSLHHVNDRLWKEQ